MSFHLHPVPFPARNGAHVHDHASADKNNTQVTKKVSRVLPRLLNFSGRFTYRWLRLGIQNWKDSFRILHLKKLNFNMETRTVISICIVTCQLFLNLWLRDGVLYFWRLRGWAIFLSKNYFFNIGWCKNVFRFVLFFFAWLALQDFVFVPCAVSNCATSSPLSKISWSINSERCVKRPGKGKKKF